MYDPLTSGIGVNHLFDSKLRSKVLTVEITCTLTSRTSQVLLYINVTSVYWTSVWSLRRPHCSSSGPRPFHGKWETESTTLSGILSVSDGVWESVEQTCYRCYSWTGRKKKKGVSQVQLFVNNSWMICSL